MKNFLLMLFAISASLLLTGCPSRQSWPARQSPEYAKGFEDGCQSAERWWQNNLADYRVIDSKAENDPLYKEGWHAGYDTCYAEKETEIQMSRGRF